ncbi:ABC-type sugar transport system, periplasmic component [Halobacteroides halobius DSM 5150]|uniref:ABC-type sugar transport system, periplasmic component n=1 Tax=Halobacteroides halobius (strain ATCC 35273 / DSM 5150 / MD-1) TaxID=748449 RepID=L0KCE1_HALHC|nr:ABC transporter substrate-binding protein [Halobacteroides halobius]AGB41743.1 ABC-type sugar transport system, periplasmic component [Halobacteroides halobius DSM 5150]
MFKKESIVAVLSLVLVLALSVNAGAWWIFGDDEEKKNKVVELTFWHGMESGANNKALKKKVKEFNQSHPDIQVDLQSYGAADDAESKVMTSVAGGNPPEMMWMGPHMTGQLAEAGVLAPVSEFIKNDPSFNKDDIYDSLWKVSSYQGKIYTAPFEANNLGIFYNKDYFKQAGIKELPDTWTEFIEVAKKVQENSDAEYGFQVPMGTGEWTVWNWEAFLKQAGGEFLKDNGTKIAFDSKDGAEALQYWVDLVHKYKVAEFSQTGAGYKTGALESGRIAMQIIGPWTIPQLNKTDLNYGTFMLPKQEERGTSLGGENLYIFKTTERKEKAAWKFAKYVMSADFQVEWAKKTGYLPVSKSAMNSDEYQNFLDENPAVRTFTKQMKYGFARPTGPAYPGISSALGKAIEKALYQRLTPEEALENAAKKGQEALNE